MRDACRGGSEHAHDVRERDPRFGAFPEKDVTGGDASGDRRTVGKLGHAVLDQDFSFGEDASAVSGDRSARDGGRIGDQAHLPASLHPPGDIQNLQRLVDAVGYDFDVVSVG